MLRGVVFVAMAGLGAGGFPAAASAAPAAAPTICLVPLGEHDTGALPVVVRGIEHLYGLEVRTLEARPMPASAWYQPRRRYRAEKLLAWIDAEVVPGSGCQVVMGFTGHDISTTKKHHADWGMLGYANIGGRSGVVSTHRMVRRVSRRTALMRAVKVTNHELGHVLGLEHDDGCLMNDLGGTVRSIDREPGLLCDASRLEIAERRRIWLPARTRIDWRRVLRR